MVQSSRQCCHSCLSHTSSAIRLQVATDLAAKEVELKALKDREQKQAETAELQRGITLLDKENEVPSARAKLRVYDTGSQDSYGWKILRVYLEKCLLITRQHQIICSYAYTSSAQGVMGGEENEQIGIGEDWVCFDVEKEYGEEEDEVLWPHSPEERYGEKIDAREGGRQAEKGQTSNDLVPGFERMDQAGHCCSITTGDRSGKMAINPHQSHSSADSAT